MDTTDETTIAELREALASMNRAFAHEQRRADAAEAEADEWESLARQQHAVIDAHASWPPTNPQVCGWCIAADGDTPEAKARAKTYTFAEVREHAATCAHHPARAALAPRLLELARIRARVTTLSLAANLPGQVWSELCHLDTDLSALIMAFAEVP